MIYVLLSVICSVSVAIILKLAKNHDIDGKQIVMWNYPVAIFLSVVFFKPTVSLFQDLKLVYPIVVPIAVLLPLLFIFIHLSIRHAGLVKTEVAQRLSLFIPLSASFLLFHETIVWNKIAGILVGFLAIVCSIAWRKTSKKNDSQDFGSFLFPLIVFIGIGVVDILLKQVALNTSVLYSNSLILIFIGALILAIFLMSYWIGVKREKFEVKAMVLGLILGLFNFGNILFYMKAHKALPDNPSVVFAGMNIGVITFGTLVGAFFFKEKLKGINWLGILFAIFAVLIIAYL